MRISTVSAPARVSGATTPRAARVGRARSLGDRVRRSVVNLHRARQGMAFMLVGLLVFSGYGTLTPGNLRCSLPGAIGCPGGILGAPAPGANSTNALFFNISMYDYGFWIVNTATGANESSSWTVYEGWTVHVNATSLKANAAVGGTAYHGIGIELNETGQHLLTVNAGVGKWVSGQFTAPNTEYIHQHIWCTIECGPGHGGMEAFVLNIIPATFIPTASATASPTSGTAPLAVALTGKVTGGTSPFTYSWNFGDGSSGATTLTTTHTYSLSGSYSAKFTVTDAKSYVSSASVSISVTSASALGVVAQATPSTGTSPVVANLSAAVSGGVAPYRYSWDLGDGSTSTSASLSHLYTAPGVYAATVTVTDSQGTTSSSSASVAVHAATGTFGVTVAASPTSGAAPLAVTLTATPSGGTGPYATLWVFGDGSYGSGATASHTYPTNGLYEAAAFVTDASGRVGSNATQVSVTGGSGGALSVSLIESPSSGQPPLPVWAAVSIRGGTAPYATPTWTFGDGGTSSGNVVTHTYTQLGSYNVTVSVTDAAQATATAKLLVRVAGVVVSISLNRTTGDAPWTVSAGATVVGGTGIYGTVTWQWGDGASSTGNPANHSYSAASTGVLTVTATVNDSAGVRANASATVTIYAPPTGVVTNDYTTKEIPPVNVTFHLNVTGGSGGYSLTPLWNFGDGSTTRGPSPQNHTYTRPGHYLVNIVTNDSLGSVVNQSAWLNISGGAATSGGGGGGGGATWTFTGVNNPDEAALGLLGLMALSGLFLMWRSQRRRAKAATAAPARRPAPPAGPATAGARVPPRNLPPRTVR